MRTDSAYWLAEVDRYDREFRSWRELGKRIIERYRDDRDGLSPDLRRFNILWSNIQVQRPLLYARKPEPAIERRFRQRDPVSRLSSEILERANSYELDCYDFDAVMSAVVEDLLLVGRGVPWIRYAPKFTTTLAMTPMGPMPTQQMVGESVVWDYMDWRDFGHTVARTWAEVTRVWRWTYHSRADLIETFGEEIGRQIPMDGSKSKDDGQSDRQNFMPQARLCEIWDKTQGVTVVLCKGMPEVLSMDRPRMDFHDFFPVPRPLFATTTNDTLVPCPDYEMYKDQARAVDRYTQRIGLLNDSIRVAGFYAGSEKVELAQLFNGSANNVMIPVDDWAAFAEKGGTQGMISWLPLGDILVALKGLYEARAQEIQVIYEVTGISDILRGSSDPNETLGAQELKAQTGSIRIRDRQTDVQRLARDMVRMQSEVICEVFQPETLASISGAQSMGPQEQQAFPQAVALLKNDVTRNYAIDVETDSTIAPDENKEKADRMEFAETFGGLLKSAVEMMVGAGPAAPALIPLVAEVLKFTASGFRVSRPLEGIIDESMGQLQQLVQGMAQQAQQPQQPQQDPRLALDAAKLQMEAGKVQGDQQLQARQQAMDEQAGQRDARIKIAEIIAGQQPSVVDVR